MLFILLSSPTTCISISCQSSDICMTYCVLRFAYPLHVIRYSLFYVIFSFVGTLGINVCLVIYHLSRKNTLNLINIELKKKHLFSFFYGHFTIIGFMSVCGSVN